MKYDAVAFLIAAISFLLLLGVIACLVEKTWLWLFTVPEKTIASPDGYREGEDHDCQPGGAA